MKAIFEYEKVSGAITDSTGIVVYMAGMIPFEDEEKEASQSNDIDGMIKLKNAGFTAEEIIAMKKAGIA